MTTKITLVLSMSLNVVLGLAILQTGHRPVSLGDFRDAVADTHTAVPAVEAAPAEVLPPAVTEPAITDAPPAAAAVEQTPPPPPVIVANDWEAYRQEMAEDRDVLVSNIFRSQKNARRAMGLAEARLQNAGKEVLFSCLMPATGGGMFYLIRTVPSVTQVPRPAAAASMADLASKDYVKEMQFITDKTEKEVWGSI